MAGGMVIRVRFQGVAGLRKKLRKLAGEVTAKRELVSALKKGAEPIRKAASQKAPRDKGTLSESIAAVQVDERAEVAVVAGPGKGKGSRKTFYAHMQEFGTAHHAAHPFVRPAYDERKWQAVQIVRDELARAVRKAAK